ncbi:uncharacterized protein F4807DRAFT_469232 [Annulohypoxylon truncatum]|uniref:uncharacterized protein n=1 Tax=Annulohypoxylon truncatum TaxID=327061 RepID=UPI00200836C0|nr:uncharacterized protein F4807DRAFT_469232 [Annulohypoxylon truncatum]KAI1207740.1 hypothetical protein F4807DRAFT_469232 [Annulohypoxylon truncatum]
MGKSEKPEEGDKVSWSWGGGAPAGTVAETKEHGAIEIETQRGNMVKRKADPGNPAVRVERSGNDVVKRSSELTVEEKASESGKAGTKRKAKGQNPEEDGKKDNWNEGNSEEEAGQKDHGGIDVDGDDEEPHTKNKQGKEVKKGGKEANKKQKRERENEDEEDEPELKDDEYVEDEAVDVPDSDENEGEEAKRSSDNNDKHVVFKGSETTKNGENSTNQKTKASDEAKGGSIHKHEGDKVSARTRSHTD